MQLQAEYKNFQDKDIKLVLITYDSEADQEKFRKKHKIEFPFFSDVDRESVTALGIMNMDQEPGDFAYGIPHPGFYVLDTTGKIVAKSFLEHYEQRLSASSMLKIADLSL